MKQTKLLMIILAIILLSTSVLAIRLISRPASPRDYYWSTNQNTTNITANNFCFPEGDCTDERYVNIDGDNMTGNLNVSANVTVVGILKGSEGYLDLDSFLRYSDGSQIRVGADMPFSGLDRAIVIANNQTVGAGVTEFAFIDINSNKVLRTLQSGKNFTWAYMRNSQGIFGDNGSTNTTRLQDPGISWNNIGIQPFLDYNTADEGASLGVEWGIETQKVIVHDDANNGFSLFEGLFKVIGREGDDIDLYNVPVHLTQDVIIEVGKADGDNIIRLDADFDLVELSPMVNENTPDDWEVSINGLCPAVPSTVACVIADDNCKGGDLCVMNSTFSTEQLRDTYITFWLNTERMTSGGDFEVTIANSTDEVSIYSLVGTNVLDTQLTFALPSGMDNQSEVTTRFYFTTSHPNKGQVGVDNIVVNGTLKESSLQNVTVENAKIEFGDGTCYIEKTTDENLTQLINIVCSQLKFNGEEINGSGGGGVTSHVALTNLEFADSGHTFLLGGETLDIGSYDLTTTGTIQRLGVNVCLANGTDCGYVDTNINNNATVIRAEIESNATQYYPNATVDALILGNISTVEGNYNSTSWVSNGPTTVLKNITGKVGIGTNTPGDTLDVRGRMRLGDGVFTSFGDEFELAIFDDEEGYDSDWSYAVAGNGYPVINLGNSGGSLASPSNSPSEDGYWGRRKQGHLTFYGYANGWKHSSAIMALTDGVVDNTHMPTKLAFVTSETSISVSYNEPMKTQTRMIIMADGKIGMGTVTPTHKVNVVGDINVTADLIVGDDIEVADDLTVGDRIYLSLNSYMYADTGGNIHVW